MLSDTDLTHGQFEPIPNHLGERFQFFPLSYYFWLFCPFWGILFIFLLFQDKNYFAYFLVYYHQNDNVLSPHFRAKTCTRCCYQNKLIFGVCVPPTYHLQEPQDEQVCPMGKVPLELFCNFLALFLRFFKIFGSSVQFFKVPDFYFHKMRLFQNWTFFKQSRRISRAIDSKPFLFLLKQKKNSFWLDFHNFRFRTSTG